MTIALRTSQSAETTISATDEDGQDLLPEDRGLLDAYRRGERDALQRLYDFYADRLARFLRAGLSVATSQGRLRFGAPIEADLEELMQDTFVRAFSAGARSGYDGLRPFGAYLVGIAKNLAIDRARKKGRETRHLVEAAESDWALPRLDASEDAERAELQGVITAFLADRDAFDRDIFRERYVKNLSLRKAAQALGVGVFRVRRRDVNMRRDLLLYLRNHGYLEHHAVTIGIAGIGEGA